MNPDEPRAFDPSETYVFLEDGGEAPLVPVDAGFWPGLMSGKPTSPGAARVLEGQGWLFGIYSIDQDARAWEMHPSGDEILVMISGAMDVVLERDGRELTLSLEPGRSCRVPQGTWHRQVARRPGRYLGATYGRGTRHRPR